MSCKNGRIKEHNKNDRVSDVQSLKTGASS